MKLRFINTNSCPVCNEHTVVAESIEFECGHDRKMSRKIRQHTNGQQWEKRQFLCGCVISHIPNFDSSYVTTECGNSEDKKELEKEREEINKQIDSLRKKISDLPAFKQRPVETPQKQQTKQCKKETSWNEKASWNEDFK